ncbi:glycerol-3-phosphate acyltransferase 1, mitochondrial-like [Biomphalaria glabrata]|uniref:Glycerol-3-phosphate acyltransferase 1, mitochondrial-like n=1 Tax=Biomphalaria glabrata TaxID=6526 RepID=A0A9W2YBU3_BIOGL|nr:glycerol-3-phosphate acyltransferase 1, mitochondrial-like [Biomphalaria glabrata]XP_055860159.1 glycerol-3-phosphate acyltransferase 1, mitochondrial-like [Biomphalaria glabrata]
MSMPSTKMRMLGGNGPQPQFKKAQPQRRLLRKRTTQVDLEKQIDIQTICAFKMAPSFQPDHFMTKRPLMGACCACMLLSKSDFVRPELRELGMRNILDVRTEMANTGYMSRWFADEAYALRRPLFYTYPDVSMSVLRSPRVLNAIEQTASQEIQILQGDEAAMQRHLSVIQKHCIYTINKMKASVSSVFIKITAWFLTKFLSKFLRSVQVCRAQMLMVKQASEKGVPMIYLPLHRSHLDYILVTYILWHYDIRAPYVAAGDNMDIPFFNVLMRWLGGFFIRRRLDTKAGQKDFLYRAILHEYMTKLLSNGEGLEFFIEGGRTRSGKAVIPKGGLLSVVVEACNEEEISDAYIVPITFSYEKIIDGNYSREQMGQGKVKETFFGAVNAIFRVFFNSYGSVRIDFAQPFSLKEFLLQAKSNPYQPLTAPTTPGRLQLDYGTSYPNFSQTLLSTNGDAEKTRMMVKALADHTVYTSDHSTAPMATHLVAFLLLTKYRQGVYTRELSKAIQWLVRELQALQRDVGFCGRSEDVLLYVQTLLGDRLITKKWNEEDNDLKLFPNLTLPAVFELSYYGNLVTTHFALESILAVAVLLEADISLFNLLTAAPLRDAKVSREKVIEVAEEICMIVHNEFIFIPPCENLNSALVAMLESFITKEILSVEDDTKVSDLLFAGKDRRWADRLALVLDVDEEENDGYYSEQTLLVNLNSQDIRERLHFLASVIGPFLESYQTAAKFTLQELIAEQPEEEFMSSLGQFARKRVEDGLTLFSESCAMMTLKSAMKSFQDLELVYCYNNANLTMIGMSMQMDSKNTLEHYSTLLESAVS